MQTIDPTTRISVDFETWSHRREANQQRHIVDGVPDYAFALDLSSRRKLAALAPIRALAQAVLAAAVPITRGLLAESGVMVGPHQFPEIHGMAVACAERLGIAVPQVFVLQNPVPNAFTLAAGHVDQIVCVHSGLIEMIGPTELHFVIGHECGHIHNEHSVYNTMWELLTNRVGRSILASLGPLGQAIAAIAYLPLAYLLGRWHRCAEVTSDRAGLICTGDLDASQRALASLSMGRIASSESFDVDVYREQVKTQANNPMRWTQLLDSHPSTPRRVAALTEFARSDVWGSWRPECAATSAVPLAAIDDAVGKFIL